MSTFFGKLVRKFAEAALDELATPDDQRRSEAISREMRKARKAEKAREAGARFFEGLAQHISRSNVREDVTAVLRRQVPPRGEPPRSWLGGLPMLPDTIEWPRARNSEYPEAGEIPLNFAAQIACADLPQELWGGLGPRDGWLVFFVATWGCASFEDKGSIRVFHTRELGRERHSPADKRSVGDPAYSGGDNPALNYARWPVDVLAFPNHPAHPSAAPWRGDEPVSPIPPDFAAVLYDGAPVATGYWHPSEEPFTWGAVAMMLERTLARRSRRQDVVRPVELLAEDGRDLARAAIAQEEAQLAEQAAQPVEPERQAQRDRYVAQRRAELAQQRDLLAQAGGPFDPARLAALIEQSQAERRAWLEEQDQVMARLLAEARSHSPRALLSPAERFRLAEHLSASHGQWHLGMVTPRNRVPCPEYSVVTLGKIVAHERSRSVAIAARDLYAAGPKERASLPEDLRLAVEADLRRLEDNRPHRLGGIHQDVQETGAPDGKVLLLQLGTDAPTGFSWGDSGALFAWIGIDALARGDFSDIQWWTENT